MSASPGRNEYAQSGLVYVPESEGGQSPVKGLPAPTVSLSVSAVEQVVTMFGGTVPDTVPARQCRVLPRPQITELELERIVAGMQAHTAYGVGIIVLQELYCTRGEDGLKERAPIRVSADRVAGCYPTRSWAFADTVAEALDHHVNEPDVGLQITGAIADLNQAYSFEDGKQVTADHLRVVWQSSPHVQTTVAATVAALVDLCTSNGVPVTLEPTTRNIFEPHILAHWWLKNQGGQHNIQMHAVPDHVQILNSCNGFTRFETVQLNGKIPPEIMDRVMASERVRQRREVRFFELKTGRIPTGDAAALQEYVTVCATSHLFQQVPVEAPRSQHRDGDGNKDSMALLSYQGLSRIPLPPHRLYYLGLRENGHGPEFGWKEKSVVGVSARSATQKFIQFMDATANAWHHIGPQLRNARQNPAFIRPHL